MIEHRLATRSGWTAATFWLIIPPIEAPTRCARSAPRCSISPTVSAAMSSSV